MKKRCIWLPPGMIGALRIIAKRDYGGDLDEMIIKDFYNLIAAANDRPLRSKRKGTK